MNEKYIEEMSIKMCHLDSTALDVFIEKIISDTKKADKKAAASVSYYDEVHNDDIKMCCLGDVEEAIDEAEVE